MNEFVYLTFSHKGKEYYIVLPRMMHLIPIASYINNRVFEYLRRIAAKNREVKYIVDVGASVGAWTIPYALIFPDAEILAIEPSKFNMYFLELNCRAFPQIKLVKMIVHNKKDRLRIAVPTPLQRRDIEFDLPEAGLISVYGASEYYAESVDADTLDNIVDEKRVVDWLKVDVEGHEIPVLEGAERILTKDRPVLQVEIRGANQEMAGSTIWKLNGFIMSRDYSMISDIRGDTVYIPNERIRE